MKDIENQYNFIIPGNPISKKNSSRIMINQKTGKHFIYPSKQYKEFEQMAGWAFSGKDTELKIDYPVNVACHYYMKTRRKVDLVNLLEATNDVLVKYGILEDDNCKIVVSHDGSRIFYDKENPRTEIIISKSNFPLSF